MSNNLLMFYLFFEASLIPMYYLIVTWGSRERRLHAAYMYFFYTLLGSIFLITGILLVFLTTKTLTTPLLYYTRIDVYAQRVIWILLFVGFAIKVPLPPFHTWLPEAHVEAPTAGSVILAGVLLKVGTFGMYKFIVPVVPNACAYFSSVIFVVSV